MQNQQWSCPVCGYVADNSEELDDHIKDKGHVLFDSTEDKGVETPEEPSDLEFSEKVGYTPGISSGDIRNEKSDLESRDRILDESKNKDD